MRSHEVIQTSSTAYRTNLGLLEACRTIGRNLWVHSRHRSINLLIFSREVQQELRCEVQTNGFGENRMKTWLGRPAGISFVTTVALNQ